MRAAAKKTGRAKDKVSNNRRCALAEVQKHLCEWSSGSGTRNPANQSNALERQSAKCRAEVCCTVEKSKPEFCSAAFHWEMLALMIPLHLALICTSTVLSLLVRPFEPIQPLRIKPNSVPALSNNISTHGGSSDSLLSLPTCEVLDRGYNESLLKLNLSVEPIFNCNEGWGRL